MITLNGRAVEFGQYPNGETLINNAPNGLSENYMTFQYETDADLIQLMLLKRHLGDVAVALTIRYMPYSRMDRAGDGTVFTLKYVAEFINSLNFRSVMVEEPHSDVTCALLDRSSARYPTIDLLSDIIGQIGWHKDYDYLFFPDAGAQKRYANVLGYKTAVGFKHRDFATGKLSGEMDVVGFKSQADPTKVLILDDLCSRGGTFIMAADKLRDMGADQVYLFVAHCENTMWEGSLLDHIDGLYCTDSIISPPSSRGVNEPKVHVYSDWKWL